jgi:chemotaxis protein histidine kinase CheA
LEFFADEATDYLDKLDQTLDTAGQPDSDELRRLSRALRGSARMADQEAIARGAGALQTLATELGAGRRHWSPELRATLISAFAEVRQMVGSLEAPPPDLAARAEALAERLGEVTAPPPPPSRDDDRFRRYLGTELRGLASDIGDALVVLERDPRNREPLKKLLRRIRPLRGIEGVDDIPGVGPAVMAVEEVILRIADTSATVGPGHLVLFRRARQALDDVATELIRGGQPDVVDVGGPEIEDLKEECRFLGCVLRPRGDRQPGYHRSHSLRDGPRPQRRSKGR